MLAAKAQTSSPSVTAAGKVTDVLRGLETYVSGLSELIIDYATARRSEERYRRRRRRVRCTGC